VSGCALLLAGTVSKLALMGRGRKKFLPKALIAGLIVWLLRLPAGQAQALLPQLAPRNEATADGALLGAAAGTYTAAWAVFSQGAGGGSSSALPWLGAGFLLGALAGGAAGYDLCDRGLFKPANAPPSPSGPFSLVNPRAGQFDVQIENLSGFTGPGSIARVREFSLQGTGLHFNALGMHNQQMPTLDLRWWLTGLSALHFRFRYFDNNGSHFFTYPVNFNGATIAPNQILSTGHDWYSGGFYYERRLIPWYQDYQSNWPRVLRGWDLRARVGIEFTYINFVINGGHARVVPTSHGEESKEDYYHQEMPLPTIGFEAYRQLSESFVLQGSIEGNWINRWNSLRDEGGKVWASESGFEAHARIFYNPRYLGPLSLMTGIFVYYYRQDENSSEDGNFIRWSSYGPEAGINVSF